MATTEAPATPTTEAPVWHVLTRDVALQELGVEPERGLTSDEAAERLERYGPNRFAEARAESRWHAFVRQYHDPMQIVLVVAGVISIYPVKQPGTGIVILLLTLLNAPDQLLARAWSHLDPELSRRASTTASGRGYLGENKRLAAKGLRVMATARKDFDPEEFD